METFGQRLLKALQSSGLSQKDLATELRTYPANVSWWINGRTSPNVVSLRKMLDLLPEIDARWLVTGVGQAPVRRRMTYAEMAGHVGGLEASNGR